VIATWGTSLLSLSLLLQASAQQAQSNVPESAQDSNAACIERVQVPSYPPLARQAQVEGVLVVNVKLAPNATVKEVSAQSHLNVDRFAPILLEPIKKALRKSEFRRDCAGKSLVLVFEFRIEGDPSNGREQDVSFGYPNRFFITVRPAIAQP
jgi:hypothetical protein